MYDNRVRKEVADNRTLEQWFDEILITRRQLAHGCFTLICAFFYILLVISLRITLRNGCSYAMSTDIVFALAFSTINGIRSYCVCQYILRFDQEERLLYSKTESWIYFFLAMLVTFINQNLILESFDLTPKSEFNIQLLFFVVIFHCSFANVFCFDYQLRFPPIEFHIFHRLKTSLLMAFDCVIKKDLVVICKRILVAFILLGLPLNGLSTFSILFSPSLLYVALILTFFHTLLHNLSVRVFKSFFVKRYSFDFPPPHAILDAKPEDQRTLLNAVNSSLLTLKAFAFFDLCRLTRSESQRRSQIFTLSQPGSYPRIWTCIRDACLSNVNTLKTYLERHNQQILFKKHGDLKRIDANGLELSKNEGPTLLQMNLMKKVGNSYGRAEFANRKGITKRSDDTGFSAWQYVESKLNRNENPFPEDLIFFSMMSIESLSALACYSTGEDNYGLIQKDLVSILSCMLQLSLSLSKFIKNSKFKISSICALDLSLNSAFSRIVMKFGYHLKECTFSAEESGLLHTFIQMY